MPTAPIKYSLYKFNKSYVKQMCSHYGGTGVVGCTGWTTHNLKVGDIVVVPGNYGATATDPETGESGVNGQVYGGGLNGAQTYVPLSYLTLIASDVDSSQVQTYMSNLTPTGALGTYSKFPNWLKVAGGILLLVAAIKGIHYFFFSKKAQ